MFLYAYKIYRASLHRTDFIKGLQMFLDYSHHFYNHNCLLSQRIEALCLFRSVTFFSSFLYCLCLLFAILVGPGQEYASVIWNYITSGTGNARIQQKFGIVCSNCYSPYAHYCYAFTLETVQLT
jgi:hypothetical protein